MDTLDKVVGFIIGGVICFVGGAILGSRWVHQIDYAKIFREEGKPTIIRTYESARADDTYIQSQTDSTMFIRDGKYFELIKESQGNYLDIEKERIKKRLEEK